MITFKEFLLESKKAEKKKKKEDEKEIADWDNERTNKSYRTSNAIKSVGMGHGVK